jgi:hypothetical protein
MRAATLATLAALAACTGDFPGAPPVQPCTDAGRCDGACVDPESDLQNCGGCGVVCPAPSAPGQVAACVAGRCGGACAIGRADCDGDPTNGCEADLGATATCGRCDNPCRAPDGTSARCDEGTCRVRCDEGRGDCDGDTANGCESELSSAAAHCGACGNACRSPHASARCDVGRCAMGACDPSFGDCDGDTTNGCETALDASNLHCGACGMRCLPTPNTAANCQAGRCERACLAGFADCDGDAANGCEVDLRASPSHCGACGNTCRFANAAARCEASRCVIDRCDAGRGDCDRNAANGCETATATALLHCGACGNACPARPGATATCAAGVCGFRCQSGLADCDGNPANGCEVDLDTSRDHCGRCLNRCAGADRVTAALCVTGACRASTCAAGWRDCNGLWADGSEVALGTPEHCAGCGDRCPSTLPRCVAAGATFACMPR